MILTKEKQAEHDKRDQDLIHDYRSDMKLKDITAKYNIGVTRMYQILSKYKVVRKVNGGLYEKPTI